MARSVSSPNISGSSTPFCMRARKSFESIPGSIALLARAHNTLVATARQAVLELGSIESELADEDLYTAEAKYRLNELLLQQGEHKRALEDLELDWLRSQEALENLNESA